MLPPTLPSPSLLPYLSSAEAGWDGLLAEAYRQLPEMEGHILPGETDIELALFTGGTMRMEAREVHAHQSWDGATLRDGDFILNAGTNLSYELRWRCLSPIPTYSFRLHLSRGLLARTVEELTGGHALQLELAEQKSFQDPFLMQMALRLWRELEERAPSGKLFAHCAAQLLLLHLLRYYAGSGEVLAAIQELPHTLTPQQLQRVSTYIRSHAGQELTMEVLAQQAGFSPSHFHRLFLKTTGETPHQYVRRERLAHARRLLESTQLSLAEVAVESGFADQSYFTRVFKRTLRVTPAVYRREHTS